MPPYSDGNLTVWKDWQRIVLSHSTKYGKKSFLGLKKSSVVDFQGSVVMPAVACQPPVHMLMSQSLIVSSYFNLQHGVGGERGFGRGWGAADRSVSTRERWDERKRDDGPGEEERAEAVGSWGMERRRKLKTKDEEMKLCRRRRKAKCLTRTEKRWGTWEGRMRLLICKEETIR